MWRLRPAQPSDAAQACLAIRRSIEVLCGADHDGDPAILEPWLANKTPDRVRGWIEANPAGVLVGVDAGGIAGVGCVLPDGTVALNYVAPWAQRRGVGRGLLRGMEQVAAAAGHAACTLTSTASARGFYLRCGYVPDGAPVRSFGSKPAFPMRRVLSPARSGG